MKELKNITKVWSRPDLPDYLIGLLPTKTVTLISKEDGSLPYPDLFAKSIESFSEHYFYISDTNSLELLVDKKTGTIITPEKILDIKFDNDTIPIKEKAEISKFYTIRWDLINDNYYIYEDPKTSLKALVRKANFELALSEWYKQIKHLYENIFILKNEKEVLYNAATNTFFNMQPSIITPISSSLVLIGDEKDKQRLYRIRDNQTLTIVFETHNLYLTENDFFKLRNGQYLINANDSVYLI